MREPFEIVKNITETIANDSFRLFRDNKFRKLVDFEAKEQTEQDRIFNEIVVSGISLAVLMFDTLAKINERNNEKAEQFFLHAKMEMRNYYCNWLKSMGVDNNLTDIWKKLIDLRVAEYQKDKERYLKKEDLTKGNIWQHIVAIGGYDHITRGKGEPEDELFKIFIHFIDKMAQEISKQVLKV